MDGHGVKRRAFRRAYGRCAEQVGDRLGVIVAIAGFVEFDWELQVIAHVA